MKRAGVLIFCFGALMAVGAGLLMSLNLGSVCQLDAANPPASVFRLATGATGYRLFGIVMWSAAITSVVGAAYTSVAHSELKR